MNNKIIAITIFFLFISIVMAFFFFSDHTITAMNQELCEMQGGTWEWMEIARDAENGGHDLFYQCICPDNGLWIKQGQNESCN